MNTENSNTPEAFNHPGLAKLKPYILVVLRKGERYNEPETPNIIRNEHLPYTFGFREKGIMAITMPAREPDSEIAAIGIFTITDKEEVNKIMMNDPAVQKKVFLFEILDVLGLQGDSLP